MRGGAGRSSLLLVAVLTAVFGGCSSDGASDDVSLPEVAPETVVVPGESYLLTVGTHCGVRRLGLPVNDVFWISDEPDSTSADWMPIEWADSVNDGLIPLAIVLASDGSELDAQVAGRTVTYRPIADTDPDEYCA